MNLEIRQAAVEDLGELDKQDQRKIRNKMKRLKLDPLGENVSLLSKQGLEIYRLKIKTKELDHRVFFDIDGGKIVVLGIYHRDLAYTSSSIKEIKSRQ